MLRQLTAALVLLQPAAAAQTAPHPDSAAFVLQVRRPFHLAEHDRVGGLIIVGDTAVIDGTVDQLIIINGTAHVRGTVSHDVIVVRGRLELTPSALIGHDVVLYQSTLTRAPGTVVGGTVHEQTAGFTFSERFLFLFWLSMTVAVAAAGLIFATFGSAQLTDTVVLLRHDTGRALVTTLVLWATLPFVAVLAIISGIGIPLGIGIFVFLLPALWFVGYLVAGAFVGMALLRRLGRPRAAEHPYAPILVGLITLQALGLVPGIGWLVAMVAGLVGSGAIAARAWKVRRTPDLARPTAILSGT